MVANAASSALFVALSLGLSAIVPCAMAQDKSPTLITREVGLGTVRSDFFPNSLRITSDGKKVCYLAGRGSATGFIVRGEDVTPFSQRILGGAFSPDGQRVIIQTSVGDRYCIVTEDLKSKCFENISSATPVFSSDGKRAAYGALRAGKWFYVVDGAEGGPFEKIDTWTFSPDGRRTGHVASLGGKWFAVIDGKRGETFDRIYAPVFSPDSRRVAYPASLGDKWFVVADGVRGKTFDTIIEPGPVFSPNGKRLAYAVTREKQAIVVSDGIESETYEGVKGVLFSPDSKHVAYMAWRDGTVAAVIDGKFGKTYDAYAGGLAFSPDSKRVAFGAKRAGQYFVVVDGVEGNTYEDLEQPGPVFGPDSKHVAYCAKKAGKWHVVVDGVESGSLPGGTLAGTQISFDSPTTLHVIAHRGLEITRVEVEIPE